MILKNRGRVALAWRLWGKKMEVKYVHNKQNQ